MANCGSCGSNKQICTCHFAGDGSTTTVSGSGTITNPVSFSKVEGPNPRPVADLARSISSSSLTVPISTQTLVPFDLNQMIRSGINFGDPAMVTVANRITFTTAGKYFVGGMLLLQALTTVVGDNSCWVYLSQGTPAGANVYAVESQKRVADNPNTVRQALAPFSFVSVTAGQYMEMYVFSSIADLVPAGATEGAGTASMYAIWMDE